MDEPTTPQMVGFMKYIFRSITVFEYNPETCEIRQGRVSGTDIPAFDFCSWIPDDFRLLSEYFDTVYRHIQGDIASNDLKDIVVD
jgi:hypothetical protein